MVSGVAQVNVFGAAKYAVRDRRRPAQAGRARRSASTRSPTAITNANVNLPTGTMYGADKTFVVQANGQLLRAAAYGPMIIAYRNGNPVRLDEVAHVYDGIENDKSAALVQRRARDLPRDPEAARHQRRRRSSTPSRRCCRRSASSCRPAVTLDVRTDRSVADPRVGARREVHAAADHRPGRRWSSSCSCATSRRRSSPAWRCRPRSSRTFAVMYLLGYSLDNLSLMALTLSVGFVVDDAIVMLENIVRHMEMGKPPMQAALRRLEGNRLHDRLDDGVARRGVHPGAVHGRHRRPAAARVRGDHRRRRFWSRASCRSA